jgi:hypothetical protein
MWAVYLAFAITVLIGTWIRSRIRFSSIFAASVVSSVLFFLLTNFAAWLSSPVYPQTFAGLMQSYLAGLAFFNNGSYGISFFLNEITGTLVYNGIFFGAYAAARHWIPVISRTA